MATEPKRGCGYRKIGGLYMVGEYTMVPCDRLPFLLDVCPCCGEGIKQTRGTTWIQPLKLFGGDHPTTNYINGVPAISYGCTCLTKNPNCPVCFPSKHFLVLDDKTGRALLLWIGAQHYPTPRDFMSEGIKLGFSRRIKSIPRDFEPGKTWVFFAHPKAIIDNGNSGSSPLDDKEPEYKAGIITAFIPQRFERIVKQSEYDAWEYANNAKEGFRFSYNKEKGPEKSFQDWLELVYMKAKREIYKKLQADIDRGITLVPVPDDDPDHQ